MNSAGNPTRSNSAAIRSSRSIASGSPMMAPADIRRLSDEWGLVVDLHLATVRRICPSLSCVMSHHLFVEVAGTRPSAVRELPECRHVGPAPVARERAARVERAVLRDAGEAGGACRSWRGRRPEAPCGPGGPCRDLALSWRLMRAKLGAKSGAP
jgi:hypothetical protein